MSKAAEFGATVDLGAGSMANPNYGLVIYPYMNGQYRLQLTDIRKPDYNGVDGHGQIVREMCTYSRSKAETVVVAISKHPEPEAYCESLANERNCEYPRGRIRLDNA